MPDELSAAVAADSSSGVKASPPPAPSCWTAHLRPVLTRCPGCSSGRRPGSNACAASPAAMSAAPSSTRRSSRSAMSSSAGKRSAVERYYEASSGIPSGLEEPTERCADRIRTLEIREMP